MPDERSNADADANTASADVAALPPLASPRDAITPNSHPPNCCNSALLKPNGAADAITEAVAGVAEAVADAAADKPAAPATA